MNETLGSLRRTVETRGLIFEEHEVFELISTGLCIFCCKEGSRGGNDSCGPKEEIEQQVQV